MKSNKNIEKKSLYVFVNGYGMVKFQPTKIHKLGIEVQLKGKIKLPKGVFTGDGKKWIKQNYWYDLDEIQNATNRTEANSDPTDVVILPIANNKVEMLINKLASMCLEYTNMESTNNVEGANLLFTIREITKALNAINGKVRLDNSAFKFIDRVTPINNIDAYFESEERAKQRLDNIIAQNPFFKRRC